MCNPFFYFLNYFYIEPPSPPLRTPYKDKSTPYLAGSNKKAEKNALKVIQYGKWHNDGKVPTTVAREFITTTPENKQRIDKKFMENVNKALRSKVKVASLG